MTGNPNKDLCASLVKVFEVNGHETFCVSRRNGYDFEDNPYGTIKRVIDLADSYDLFINLYANYFFNASVLAHKLFCDWTAKGFCDKRIVNIGSTTDRVQKSNHNLYHYEKRMLREISSGQSLQSVWDKSPKVHYCSFGTLENRKDQNPGRKVLSLENAAQYIYWLVSQPKEIHINEISIDPVQFV